MPSSQSNSDIFTHPIFYLAQVGNEQQVNSLLGDQASDADFEAALWGYASNGHTSQALQIVERRAELKEVATYIFAQVKNTQGVDSLLTKDESLRQDALHAFASNGDMQLLEKYWKDDTDLDNIIHGFNVGNFFDNEKSTSQTLTNLPHTIANPILIHLKKDTHFRYKDIVASVHAKLHQFNLFPPVFLQKTADAPTFKTCSPLGKLQ